MQSLSQTCMVLQYIFPLRHPHLFVMPALHSIIQSISCGGSGGRSVKYTTSPKNGTNLAAYLRSNNSVDPTSRCIISLLTNQPWNAVKMTRLTMKVPTLSMLSKSRKLAYLIPKLPNSSGQASNPHSINNAPTHPREPIPTDRLPPASLSLLWNYHSSLTSG